MKEQIINLLLNNIDVFLTGKSGSGKTTLTREIIDWFNKNNISYAVTASTGVAARNISNRGRTINSFLKLGIVSNLEDYDARGMSHNYDADLHATIASLKVLIISEISMISDDFFDVIIKQLVKYDFTGAILVEGDFYQLPPVEGKLAFFSKNWYFYTFSLGEVKRTTDLEFVRISNLFRESRFKEITKDPYFQKLLTQTKFIHPEKEYTKLFSTNKEVDEENEYQRSLIAEPELYLTGIFRQLDRFAKINEETCWKNVIVEKEIILKVGVRIMLLVNTPNYANGSVGVFQGFDFENNLIVLLDSGQKVTVKRHIFEFEEKNSKTNNYDVVAIIEQFPVRLAYAITIHKSQGLSIDKLYIDFKRFFLQAQYYVALTRASNPANLIMENFKFEKFSYSNKIIDDFYDVFVKKLNKELEQVINNGAS